MEAKSRTLNAFDTEKTNSTKKKKSSVKNVIPQSICTFFQRFTHPPHLFHHSQKQQQQKQHLLQQESSQDTIIDIPRRTNEGHSRRASLATRPNHYYPRKQQLRQATSMSNQNKHYRHTLDFSSLRRDNSVMLKTEENKVTTSQSYGSIYSTFTSSSRSSNVTSTAAPAEPLLGATLEQQLQKRLWNEDPTLCKRKDIAQWLGENDPIRAHVLELYMQNFDFSHQTIDEAFRTLCSKLYFRAESQKLDRIVDAFAQRYYKCNPTTILHSADIVYAIAYSLLLLNTDLYVAQENKNVMTRQDFVKNTMATIKSILYPGEDESFYDTASLSSSTLSTISKKEGHVFGSIRSLKKKQERQLIQHLENQKKSPDPHISQKDWLANIEKLLKDVYNNIKSNRIRQLSEVEEVEEEEEEEEEEKEEEKEEKKDSSTASEIRKRRCKSVLLPRSSAVHSTVSHRYKNRRDQINVPPCCDSNEKPDREIIKQGLVMKKHLKESTDIKSRHHRHWEICYLVLTRTTLTVYRASPIEPKKSRRRQSFLLLWYSSSSLSSIVSQIPNWEPDTNQSPIVEIPINHSYSHIVPPPGWSTQRPHVFRLETGEGGLFLFEALDMFEVQDWVVATNGAAAKVSKGALAGAVSNVDYGFEGGDGTHVAVWFPPMPCMINSQLDLDSQYKEITKQIEMINHNLDHHRLLKFDNKHRSMQALENWDKKLHYLLHELMKLRVYQETLYL